MADYIRCGRGITHPYPSQEGIFRPYNLVSHATNFSRYPEDPFILVYLFWRFSQKKDVPKYASDNPARLAT
jgi:hypothetical protein